MKPDQKTQQKKKDPIRVVICTVLAALGFFFRFALRGYV